jgi:acetylornithine deacetylase
VDTDPFDLLERLVAVPCVTGSEGAYTRLLRDLLQERGYTVELPPVAEDRPNLIASPGGGPADFYFSTHLDVVPPHIPPRRDGDRLYGRGSADTKGPLVAMLAAAERLEAQGIRAGFLLVVGEEVDHCGAIAAAATLDLGGKPILLGEPTSNRVVAAQKGMLKLAIDASGIAGHSAFPERGVSAIHRLLRFLEAVNAESWPVHDVLGETTFNVGTIEGGVAANVFAPQATAQLMFRLAGPVDPVLERLRVLAPDGVSLRVISSNDPVTLSPPDGFPTCVIPFNSDASYLSPLGPVTLCGPGAIELAHSENEHIERESLKTGIETYVRLAKAVVSARP